MTKLPKTDRWVPVPCLLRISGSHNDWLVDHEKTMRFSKQEYQSYKVDKLARQVPAIKWFWDSGTRWETNSEIRIGQQEQDECTKIYHKT